MNYACRNLPFPKFLHYYFCHFLCFLSHIAGFGPHLVPQGDHLQFGWKGAIGSEPYATRATVCPLGILLYSALVASLSDCVYALPAVLCVCVHMLCVVCAVLCTVCRVLYVSTPCVLSCVYIILVIFLALFSEKSRFMRVIRGAIFLTFLAYPCYNVLYIQSKDWILL